MTQHETIVTLRKNMPWVFLFAAVMVVQVMTTLWIVSQEKANVWIKIVGIESRIDRIYQRLYEVEADLTEVEKEQGK